MKESLTPIRQQYLRIKHDYPGTIVLFRLGDFYETFDKDAEVTSRELDIVLTSREMGKGHRVPMAGIPYHALDNYLARLIARGHKVAICEQMTKPGETKGLVARDVVRVVTPGTVIEPGLLDSKANSYLLSLVIGDGVAGIAHVDITTSEFAATELPPERVNAELARLRPREIIAGEGSNLPDLEVPVTRLEDHWFRPETATETLLGHFGVRTLDGYGLAGRPLAAGAAGAIVYYLNKTQKASLMPLTHLTTYSTESFMALDNQTQRNLELFQSGRLGVSEGSLLAAIDLTKTPMGSRLLKRWLGQPLLNLEELVKRQAAVSWFVENTLARGQVISLLDKVADLERLINRVGAEVAAPRELISLKTSLETVPKLIEAMASGKESANVGWLRDNLKPRPEVVALISQSIEESPTTATGEGGVIKTGFSAELDKLRLAAANARQYLANLEREEREKTGIKSLRVGYNQVFGYYLEVSNANLAQVPEHYIRKQTLTNGERYFTPELKEYESLILTAKDRISELESDIFRQVSRQIAAESTSILELGRTLAMTDVFAALAEVAIRYSYTRPSLNTGGEIIIKQGRHPVVERSLGRNFIPNDTRLASDSAQIIVLTGPNMSGKSTYLRQVALITLLAQIGSFVPAEQAIIGLVDRIFTRIGAGEDIAAGQSTFMVEMVETANILNNATPHSLIILDEIGRGTSTYDGLAIARAVVEYLHNSPRLGAKTLFATHYHELTELAEVLPRVKNFNVAVTEEGGRVVFLYKIMPGGVDRSYGIHVAQLAGLPRPVVHRANELLAELEGDRPKAERARGGKPKTEPPPQLTLFGKKPVVIEELEKLDINSLTPLEALTKLYELQRQAGEG
jgi:DNA mismatch repair protein MutS